MFKKYSNVIQARVGVIAVSLLFLFLFLTLFAFIGQYSEISWKIYSEIYREVSIVTATAFGALVVNIIIEEFKINSQKEIRRQERLDEAMKQRRILLNKFKKFIFSTYNIMKIEANRNVIKSKELRAKFNELKDDFSSTGAEYPVSLERDKRYVYSIMQGCLFGFSLKMLKIKSEKATKEELAFASYIINRIKYLYFFIIDDSYNEKLLIFEPIDSFSGKLTINVSEYIEHFDKNFKAYMSNIEKNDRENL